MTSAELKMKAAELYDDFSIASVSDAQRVVAEHCDVEADDEALLVKYLMAVDRLTKYYGSIPKWWMEG